MDTRLLSNLIYQMNIVRRQVSTYPPGHQIILTSAQRTIKVVEHLKTSSQQVTIGVARDRLMLGSALLDPKNPVYREFSRALFSHGLVALTIHYGLTVPELCSFCRLLACKPEDILARGGIVETTVAADIKHLTVTPLHYGRFQTQPWSESSELSNPTQDGMASPWESFVDAMLKAVDSSKPAPAYPGTGLTPQELAENLSQSRLPDRTKEGSEYDKAIASFLRDLDRENLSQQVHSEVLDKFRVFIGNLHPPLRHQFLSSTFSALATHDKHAGAILSSFSNQIILQALQDINAEKGVIPPFILQMLNQLSCHGSSAGDNFAPKTTDSLSAGRSKQTPEHFKLVFAKHHADHYVPEDYQSVLQQIPNRQPPPVLPAEVVTTLKNSIHDLTMEKRLSNVLGHLLQNTEDRCEQISLKKHLSNLIQHFTDTGDFTALLDLHRQLSSRRKDMSECQDLPNSLFASYRFTREVVHGLSLWPQNKRQVILTLIERVGTPFVPLLLDRLAEEKDRSIRSQYLRLLEKMGPVIRSEVVRRLKDNRWHLLRNLIVLLRGLNDPSLMDTIEPMLRHPHQRVRQEALKTAFYFRDPRADATLLKELNRTAPQPPLWAIGLARQSRDPRVFNRLLGLLQRRDLTKEGLALQRAIVASLADIANPIALRDLERVLFGFSFLHPRRHKALQSFIVASLKHYSHEATDPIYRRLARGMRPDLADFRQRARRHISGAPS